MAKERDPKKSAHLEAVQCRRLPPGAVCSNCGESDARVLEQHHPMGRAHDPDLTIVLCKNCHRIASDGQTREGVPLRATDNLLERVGAIFAALASFFRFLADSFDRLVGQIGALTAGLDARFPEWRTALPEGV